MPNVGPLELVIVLVIALIILGPKRLPEVGKSIGKGMREFKDAVTGRDDERPPRLPEAQDEERVAEPPPHRERDTVS